MSDGCKKLICVAMIIGALALFVFSVAGIKYLNRASPPDVINLGFGVQTPKASFWFDFRGEKNHDSEKDHLHSKVNGLSR